MKTRWLVLIAVLALLALTVIPASTASAGTGAACWSDPESGPVGTVFVVYCSGFSPNTIVNAYYVEPDGTAVTYGSGKTDESGSIGAGFFSKFGNIAAISLGTWKFVVQETGLANSILAEGVATFRVTGGTEAAEGAKVWTDPERVEKGEGVGIYGSGFAPNEVVTFWYEFPNGDCSSYTEHEFNAINLPIELGLSTLIIGNINADAAGNVAFGMVWYPLACEGSYRIVGRGNSSGYGGETWLKVVGNPVSTNAWLSASPDKVAALFDWVYFSGYGYGANETVSCWLRSPQGSVDPLDQFLPSIKSDAGGNVSFSMYTGSIVPSFIWQSEGALGVYAMTCRGNTSGATAIAEFTVTGGMFDP